MFDFGAFPPEFNSGRMYAGAGAGPLLAAASAWDAVAAELATAASSYNSVVTELTSSPWLGPASRSMMAAVVPYVGWLGAVAGQAEETANQARAAVAAYEAAFAMTVPPPVIAANRVLLATLVATNFFGQNTPAIMATEAQYLEMWAQDAAAMYGYAASSAVAALLTPFLDPPNTASPNATANQSAAVAQASAQPAGNSAQAVSSSSVPQLLANAALPQAAPAATDPLPWPLSLIYDTFNNLLTKGLPTPTDNFLGLVPANYMTVFRSLSGLPYFSNGIASFGLSIGQQLYNGPLGTTAGSAGAFIPSPQFAALGAGGWSSLHPTAGLASATHIGGTGPGLSVPASWANSTGSAANTKLMTTSLLGSPEGNLNGAGANAALRGAPMVGAGRGAQRASNALGVRYGVRYSVLTRPPSAG